MAEQLWYERTENARLIAELRQCLADGIDLLVFLGAGLSYGVGRGRASFEVHEYDDDLRFPSWRGSVYRMKERLKALPEMDGAEASLESFFSEQSPIDFAQPFRDRMGDTNYIAFLRAQFGSQPDDEQRLTQSHH